MWTMLEERLTARLRSDASVRAKLRQMDNEVAAGKLAPTLAVEEIAKLLGALDAPHHPVTGFGPFPGASVQPDSTPGPTRYARATSCFGGRENRHSYISDKLCGGGPRIAGADCQAQARCIADVRPCATCARTSRGNPRAKCPGAFARRWRCVIGTPRNRCRQSDVNEATDASSSAACGASRPAASRHTFP